MKGKFGKISAGVLYAALAICVAMGGVACLVTAFPIGRYAELGTVALWCSLWAAFAAICFSYKKGHWVLLGAAALILGYMWREGTLASQLELLIYRISVQYDKGYGWGVAQWSAKPERAGSIDMALILLGCVVLTLLLRSLIRRKTVYVGLIFSVLQCAGSKCHFASAASFGGDSVFPRCTAQGRKNGCPADRFAAGAGAAGRSSAECGAAQGGL